MSSQSFRGTSRLMGAIDRMAARAIRSRESPTAETGRIDADYALLIDRSHDSYREEPLRFEPDEYQILRNLTLPYGLMAGSPNGARAHLVPQGGPISVYDPPPDPVYATPAGGAHDHPVVTPPELAPVMPGDRVLVLWTTSGYPVVVGVLMSAALYVPREL